MSLSKLSQQLSLPLTSPTHLSTFPSIDTLLIKKPKRYINLSLNGHLYSPENE